MPNMRHGSQGVSILLMLDIGLEVRHRCCYSQYGLSFNPSYAGYRSGSVARHWHQTRQNFVSILLMLDIGLEGNSRWFRDGNSQVSILLMLDIGLEERSLRLKKQHHRCFNPSYAGYRSGSSPKFTFVVLVDKFQSFLCWISVWKSSFAGDWKLHVAVSILLMLDIGLEASL